MIETSAPGSLMMTGEHAVLQGAHALAGAVEQRIHVRLVPRRDRRVTLSSALGKREMTLDRLDAGAPFTFAVAALERYASAAAGGFDLTIAADMPPDVGLGTSAAVTTSVLAAVRLHAGHALLERRNLHREVLAVIRQVQGMGSGADAAASVYGGIVLYQQETGVLETFGNLPQIALYYAGYKTPTAEVVRIVAGYRTADPERYAQLDARMDACSLAAATALRCGDAAAFAAALNEGQSILEQMGVCDARLGQMVSRLRELAGAEAVKISGSGLGDCVLVTGAVQEAEDLPYPRIPVRLTVEGVQALCR